MKYYFDMISSISHHNHMKVNVLIGLTSERRSHHAFIPSLSFFFDAFNSFTFESEFSSKRILNIRKKYIKSQ